MDVTPAPPIVLRPTLLGRFALLLLFAPVAGLFWLTAFWPGLAVLVGIYAITFVLLTMRSITIDDKGVHARNLISSMSLEWSAIDAYTYWSALTGSRRTDEPRIAGAGSVRRSHDLVLSSTLGRVRIHTAYRGAAAAIARVLETLHARLADTTNFAPFTVTDAGIARKGETLAWADVEKVYLDGQVPPRLQIIKRGKSFPWRSEKLGNVANSLLLLQRIAERGIEVDLGLHGVAHDALVERMAANAALPAARVVKR